MAAIPGYGNAAMDLGLGGNLTAQAKAEADALKKKKQPAGDSILDQAMAGVTNFIDTYSQAAKDLLAIPGQTGSAVNDIQDAAAANPAAIEARRKRQGR